MSHSSATLPSPRRDAATANSAPPPEEERRCRHCGTGFRPRFEEEWFCCSGCRVVHDLIESGGFGNFYALLGRRVLQPATHPEPAGDELDALREAIEAAESDRATPDAPARLTLRVGNLSCTACVWLIDHLFRRHPGTLELASDTARSTLTLCWNPGEFEALEFVLDLYRHGYPAGLVDETDEDEDYAESRALLTRLGVTAGLAMNTMVFTLPSYLGLETGSEFSRLFSLVAFASATLTLAVGGSYFFQRAWQAVRHRTLHMDVPISLGLAAAWLGSVGGMLFGAERMLYFDFVAIFAFLMLGGRWLHLRLLERNRSQLRARERDLTAAFRIGADGQRERIPLRAIATGDGLEIPAGAMLPVEARHEGESARFHLDWINGEPDPVRYRTGQHLPAGARNGMDHPVRVTALAPYAGSFLESLLAAEPGSDEERAPGAHPVLRFYLFGVIGVAVAGGSAWLASGAGVAAALQVFISVLVVSCPCALGLALPLLDELTLSRLKRRGVFVRRHSLWRRLRRIATLDFDKTGTLTEPTRRLANPGALDRLDPAALAALRHLTETNRHPVGRALHDVVLTRFGPAPTSPEGVVEIEEDPGKGVLVCEDGAEWRLGRGDWACPERKTAGQGCHFTRNGEPIAAFELEEAVRDGATEQIAELRRRGYRIRILSGDPDRERVATTARRLGLDPADVHANLDPSEKAALVEASDDGTLFVGDGGNDGLAFRAAAAAGTPATGIRAIEGRADFVFTGRGFQAIGWLLDAACRRRRRVVAIFVTALTYNVAAVGLCLAGFMNPLLAAVLMPLSSLVTTAMAARG